jgi:pyruvate ferredoxin oxidoreductase beta subunit
VGKTEPKKDLVAIVVAHHVPYTATASISNWKDLMNKTRKALSKEGPTFIHVLAPCTRGWRFDTAKTIKLSKLAVETRFFPIYEVEEDTYRITVPVPYPRPIEEYLAAQGRYSHLLRPEAASELQRLKDEVDGNYRRLERLAELTARLATS